MDKEKIQERLEQEARYVRISFPLVNEDSEVTFTIDLKEHRMLEWQPEFGDCRIDSKVRDEGTYSFLDMHKKLICRFKGYVPNGVVPPDNGWGDYLRFKVCYDGSVEGWRNEYDFSEIVAKEQNLVFPEDLQPITNSLHIWNILSEVLAPLAQKTFIELGNVLYPYFAYSGQFAYLSESDKKAQELLSINVEHPLSETEATEKEREYISRSKSAWVTYSVASPKMRNLGNLRFMIAYHIEFEKDTYFLPILNKHIPYGEVPADEEVSFVIQSLTCKALELVCNRKSGIVEY